MNPTAVAMWIMLVCFGYLFFDVKGAVAGLGIGLLISVGADVIWRLIPKRKR